LIALLAAILEVSFRSWCDKWPNEKS
jgi:hypothetical protein